MTHYTVMVATKTTDEAELEQVLAPYDENMDVEPYWTTADADRMRKYYSEICEEKDLPPNGRLHKDATGPELAAYLNAGDEDVQYRWFEDRLEEQSTYNPQSKWDWYTPGGRWDGSLVLKNGGTANQATKSELDIEGERKRAVDAATTKWDAWEAIVAQHGTPKTFEEILTGHGIPIKIKEYAEAESDKATREANLDVCREEYNAQPAVKAAKDTKLIGDFMDSVDDTFLPHTRETFVENARLHAIAGWAFVSADTGWVAPGDMGWFGMSSDNAADRLGYAMKLNEIIDGLPDDTVITMVDCHI